MVFPTGGTPMSNQTLSISQKASNQSIAPHFDDLIKAEDLAKERSELFTLGKLKWLIRQRHHNGLSKAGATIRCGRTILIVRSKFYEWLLANKA